MAAGPFVPFEHWPAATKAKIGDAYRAKAAAAAEPIGRKARSPRCACVEATGHRNPDGRCSRCYGWRF
jgi:hypothetical protein